MTQKLELNLLKQKIFYLLLKSSYIYLDCTKPNACQNGGTCSNGACSCKSGFGGSDCSLKGITQRFLKVPKNTNLARLSSSKKNTF